MTLSAPPFPGKIQNNDKNAPAQFTLGRLSFNIFQPKNLICTLKSIRNPVCVRNTGNHKSSHSGTTFKYDVIMDLVVHTSSNKDKNDNHPKDIQESDLAATMITKGFCYPSPSVNNRMMVTFTGCSFTLENKNEVSKLLLKENFANAYRKADQERSCMGWMIHNVLKWFLGLTYPTDADALEEAYEFSYEMKKPPSAYIDVLYLDEDIRITKGSRGTIVVVDRMK